MTTRSLEDLDGGLGSCLPNDDLPPLLEEPRSGRRPDSKALGASRHADPSDWTHAPQDPGVSGAAEKELAAKEGPGTSKRMQKAETSPHGAPAPRRRSQAAPPLKPPPPPPPSLSDDLPWGDLTLNKCLVLASLVALLGWVLQLCQNAVSGEVAVAAPQQWVPPSLPPKKSAPPSAPKPPLSVPPSGPPEPKPGPPGPQALKQDEPEATEALGEPEGPQREASGEEHAPLGDRGSQKRPRKEKPRKGEKLKEKPRKDKPRREERPPRATREPRQPLPRRWEQSERGPRPWARDSRELEPEKRHPRRRRDLDARSRQKPGGGKGRD
ncbi:junctional sarcoplasmic reticulum protein 1 isoform X2 [Mesocricetus auratus]|uniref:Junctional sarcoplasmic reticulum protein 1 isoform X2 n=1 Tax=Mesocricetus auratus TaxID=10036 RepID=A0A3Q0DBT6_MESAU|nr:junctional sarcoplasmic reticulum protein 1 isoform X2 [Mesocricetus auratus]